MSMTYKKFRGRYMTIVALSLFLWIGLLFRMFFIQVVDAAELGNTIANRFEDKVEIAAQRGNFFDRNGKKLTDNMEHFSFAARPALVQDKKSVARLFSQYFNRPQSYYLDKLNSSQPYVYLERNVIPQACVELRSSKLPRGIEMNSHIRRYYPYGEVAAPLIGFVGVENHGLSGLEQYYDHQLAGIPGWRIVGSDGRGKRRIRGDFKQKEPINGNDCYLTLDIDIQVIIEEELQAAIQRHAADKAMAVLVQTNTGEILAIASIPGFNPNSRSNLTQSQLIVHPIMSVFEPGSTFKVIGATACLETDVISPSDVLYCENGTFYTHGIKIKDWRSYQDLTFAEVIQNSSNIGIIKATERLKKSDLFNIARKFGFSEKTGLKFPYEANGSLKNYKHWSAVSKSEISIGYEISVTALQLAMAYSAIGNGGYLMQPQLVKSITTPDGYSKAVDKMDVVRQVASEKTMSTISFILERAVSSGTGSKAFLPGLRIAGKTGTAKKLRDGKYIDEYLASFASFYPADNPIYTLIVVIDNPRRDGYTGGMVAAPVAKEIYRRVYNLRETPITPGSSDKSQSLVREVRQNRHSLRGELLASTIPVIKAGQSNNYMPDLRGLSMKNALQSLYAIGVNPVVHGSGRVIRQVPAAGKQITNAVNVELYLNE